MASIKHKLPDPPPQDDGGPQLQRRLWIGNIDTKITEFALLKLLQKYGELEKFDFLYNLTEPDKGKPRGYCFATYATVESALSAQKGLHRKLALTKRLIVKPAQGEKIDPETAAKRKVTQSLTNEKSPAEMSSTSQISAIEHQLKRLERSSDTDVDAFLPANKKQCVVNPLGHCLSKPEEKSQASSSRNQSSHHSKSYKHKHRKWKT